MPERFDTPYHATLHVYFEIAAEAQMAHDEEGNPAAAWAKVSLDFDRVLTEEEQERIPQTFLEATAADMKIPLQYIRRVTRKEYYENNDEDEEGDNADK